MRLSSCWRAPAGCLLQAGQQAWQGRMQGLQLICQRFGLHFHLARWLAPDDLGAQPGARLEARNADQQRDFFRGIVGHVCEQARNAEVIILEGAGRAAGKGEDGGERPWRGGRAARNRGSKSFSSWRTSGWVWTRTVMAGWISGRRAMLAVFAAAVRRYWSWALALNTGPTSGLNRHRW